MDTSLLLTDLANSPLFIGFAMVIMNFGSRFVVGDLSKAQEKLLMSDLAKVIVVFCIFFVPTRNIMAACMLTFAFFFVTKNVLNEKKPHSILAASPLATEGKVESEESFDGRAVAKSSSPGDRTKLYALYREVVENNV